MAEMTDMPRFVKGILSCNESSSMLCRTDCVGSPIQLQRCSRYAVKLWGFADNMQTFFISLAEHHYDIGRLIGVKYYLSISNMTSSLVRMANINLGAFSKVFKLSTPDKIDATVSPEFC